MKDTPYICVDTILMVIVISGNVLTLLAIKLDRRLSKITSNLFIANLAVSDLLVGLGIPYHLIYYSGNGLSEVKLTCLICFTLITIACSLSFHSLFAIAIDRYIAIAYPLKYDTIMTKKIAFIMIIYSWVISIFHGVVPTYWNIWKPHQTCQLHHLLPTWYIVQIMTPFIILLWICLILFYFRIWQIASEHIKRLNNTNNNSSKLIKTDSKSLQLITLICGSFSLTWMPYLSVMFIQAFGVDIDDTNNIIYKTTYSLAMANSGINPIIYAWKNIRFRNAFKKLLHCHSLEKGQYELNVLKCNRTKIIERFAQNADMVGAGGPVAYPLDIYNQDSGIHEENQEEGGKNMNGDVTHKNMTSEEVHKDIKIHM